MGSWSSHVLRSSGTIEARVNKFNPAVTGGLNFSSAICTRKLFTVNPRIDVRPHLAAPDRRYGLLRNTETISDDALVYTLTQPLMDLYHIPLGQASRAVQLTP
jgi:hypothetical protein